jgi:hypothetical protein
MGVKMNYPKALMRLGLGEKVFVSGGYPSGEMNESRAA